MGECRIVTWFWPLISILVSSKQIFASSSKCPPDHHHGFLVRSSACFFLQIISLFFSSDPQRGWDNLLQLPLLRILPPLPPRQMPEAKRKCLKYFTFFYFCLFLCKILGSLLFGKQFCSICPLQTGRCLKANATIEDISLFHFFCDISRTFLCQI